MAGVQLTERIHPARRARTAAQVAGTTGFLVMVVTVADGATGVLHADLAAALEARSPASVPADTAGALFGGAVAGRAADTDPLAGGSADGTPSAAAQGGGAGPIGSVESTASADPAVGPASEPGPEGPQPTEQATAATASEDEPGASSGARSEDEPGASSAARSEDEPGASSGARSEDEPDGSSGALSEDEEPADPSAAPTTPAPGPGSDSHDGRRSDPGADPDHGRSGPGPDRYGQPRQLGLAVVLDSAVAPEGAVVEDRFRVMGTEAHLLMLRAPSGSLERARILLAELEAKWSRFRPDSELSAVNRLAGRPVVVSPETYRVIEIAIEGWRATQGRFDPTVELGPAGYDRSFDRIDAARPRPSRHRPAPTPDGVELAPYACSVTVPPGVALDLGGVGKGAAADLVAEHLVAEGAEGVCVNLGGDLRVVGRPPRPEGWRIDLACPGSRNGGFAIGVASGAVCTSTNQRRTWQGPMGPEHHLRRPDTGASIDSGVTSVTVVSARAAQAEILTKSLFVLGAGQGAAELDRFGATGLTVGADGTVDVLPGMGDFVAAGRRTGWEAA